MGNPVKLCLILIWTTILGSNLVQGGKILTLTPPVHAGSHSHLHLMTHLGNELVSRGHEVTILIYGDMPNKGKMKEVRLPAPFDKEYFARYERIILEEYVPSMIQGKYFVQDKMLSEPPYKDCETVLSSKDLHERLKKEKFDIAIVDQFFQCGFPLARLLGIPFVILECSSSISFLMDIPVPSPLSYVPVFSAHVTDDMTFLQRLKNTFMYYVINYFLDKYVVQPFNEIKEKLGVLPGTSISQLKTEAEFWLINNDFSLEFPRPMLPNTAYIGGMTSSPAKALPQEFEAYVTGAGDAGVVVISFGSVLDLQYVPELVKTLIEAVSRIPQRVVWSSKIDPPSNLPGNIRIFKWIPQNDLLGHPQTKALITHGGANSVFEAIYHGVPTLVIPATMDSIDNANRLQSKGMGLRRDGANLTPEILHQALSNLTLDPSFHKSARKYSSLMRDQPQSARERAAFWVEHVIKHGGSGSHLRIKGFDMPALAYYNIDVYILVISLVSAVVSIGFILLRCCWKCLCKKSAGKEKSKRS